MDLPVSVRHCRLGQGVFARGHFAPGDRIFTLTGMVVGFAETLRMGEAEANPIQIDHDRYIDPEPPGRYLNHSCNPNAGIVQDCHLTAIRAIAPYEEVVIDYSTTMQEGHWTMVCRCGEASCRKLITDFHLLPPALKRRYLSLEVVQSFIRNTHQLSASP